MKKVIAILLAMLLPLCASAETLREQVNAPEHIIVSIASNTGKTVINIDAPVYVPDVEQLFLIPVDSMALDASCVKQVYQLMWPDDTLPRLETDDENVTYSIEGKGTFKGYGKHSATIGGWEGDEYRGVNYRHGLMPNMDGYYDVGLNTEWRIDDAVLYDRYIMQKEVRGDGITGHALTTEQAIAVADEFVGQLVGDAYQCYIVGETDGSYYDKQSRDAAYTSVPEMSYVLVYTRVIDGVPLLPASYQMMEAGYRTDLFIPAVGYDQMFITLDRQGRVSNFFWSCPSSIHEERIPLQLMPFADIMDIAEKMLPLRYQSEEVQGEQYFRVSRISLGYMALLQRDKLTFALTPVWNFYGDYEPAREHYSYRPLLTLNAVDGTVVDLAYGY